MVSLLLRSCSPVVLGASLLSPHAAAAQIGPIPVQYVQTIALAQRVAEAEFISSAQSVALSISTAQSGPVGIRDRCSMTAAPTGNNTPLELEASRACSNASQLKLAQITSREPKHPGGWRLVRSRDPRGGADAIAMTRTADFAHSDLNLAGLMLRCAERNFEVLIVLIEPLPPKARPEVTIGDKTNGLHLTGTVVPPGAAVLLPAEAATLAAGPWQRLSEIAVQVRSDQGQTAGVIPLEGLGEAIQTLLVSCAAR